MPKISVAVVEDDSRLRKTVERVLAAADGCRLVGVFANATDAIREIPALAPDVILMDVNLPDGSGVECVSVLAPLLPNTQILMVTAFQDPDTTFRAITAGAHGYLVKPVMPKRLVEAIREVRNGGVPMSRAIARKVIEAFRAMHEERSITPLRAKEAEPPVAPPDTHTSRKATEAILAPRERQVLELLVEGYSYKEAAARLGVSIGTVGTYVNRIYEKLHVSSRREIVAWSRGGG
jgi:DNA-binding NarL/FixJ family response regulator